MRKLPTEFSRGITLILYENQTELANLSSKRDSIYKNDKNPQSFN
jgi:hypothetical protein